MKHESQLARLGLFDAKVPRYTSYPTAPHFSAGVEGGHFKGWLAAVPAGSAVSLYLHVPFCRRLCWFCACRTQGVTNELPVRLYLETLKKEVAEVRAGLPDDVRLSRLHWGGGTPTILSSEMIADLAGTVAEHFPLGESAEFSVEIDPNEIDAPRLDALAAAGMNRASIGVQDFDPEIQKVIGREQSFEITRDAVTELRARGIRSLNTDILFGLPYQTNARITESTTKLLELEPDRVALYGYAHVPWMARRQTLIPAPALPSPEARLHLFETARRLFAWAGYQEIGIDHFARPGDGLETAQKDGTLRRNFQGYTDDQARVLIGLGASSISRFPQGYAQNAPKTSEYQARVRAGECATTRGHAFRSDDVLRGRVIEALMCQFRADLDALEAECCAAPGSLDAVARTALEKFPGALEMPGRALEIPVEGRPLTRMIARCFDAYDMDASGHSSAI
ncbi:oxygen-independent coproporphyrinogen III oxidase [Maritimibacter sp. 55A14]|uniref:oxygen-independent coproporphyrinogen III oxidase n=1 Tax=Maritimibacter sp. 55A14 TaxID=2174844 RepID=UPI000D619EA2|nr:oxygen-independent coproporphyrinogen III oxidase [Maritimibacter sp. 55A14]PWE32272.1 oxygen-independent coproporphyrinogen III oxidase [Maritimibacter sp. 55A14]